MATAIQIMVASKPDDPDAQATINDFQDYTEYLPSDLSRSLGLIGKLDEAYLDLAGNVHDLTKQYGLAPQLQSRSKMEMEVLRTNISYNLDRALSARESAYGEASRLYEMVDRHYKRLDSITKKLKLLPKPPSRDPSPVLRSPPTTRKSPPHRLTLHGPRQAVSTQRPSLKAEKRKDRKRRITIPGEVLPPPNPDSPTSFTASDWESIPPSPLPMPTSRVGGSRRQKRPIRIRPPKPPRPQKDRGPRIPRQPGMGTNVHSAVAGISTSNALSLLPAPPPDAKSGSEHAPWMRLTEYEMAKLRKRMKKNAIWTPSETMIRRELADAGRGPDNYRLKKAEAEEKGEEFIDVDNIATSAPGKPLQPGEISADSLGLAETNLSNRGMKLNEAKKLKREAMLAESAKEMEKVTQRLGDFAASDLFSPKPASTPLALVSPKADQKDKSSRKEKTARRRKSGDDTKASPPKRRREDEETTDKADSTQASAPQPESVETVERPSKKRHRNGQAQRSPLVASTVTNTVTVPLAAPAPSPPQASHTQQPRSPSPLTSTMSAPSLPKIKTALPRPISTARDIATATSSRPHRNSLTLRPPSKPPSPSQPSPRTASLRGSTGPPSATLPQSHRESLRRKSATPATPTTPAKLIANTAAKHRSKRPAPGTVVKDQEGGATISVGRRAHAPHKRGLNLGGNRNAPTSSTANNAALAHTNANPKDKESLLKAEEAAAAAAAAAGEPVDPNEPRYCLCGDVSYGEMVGCDNDDCEREWFHFECVGLTEHPPRRTKWYCPPCRKLGFGGGGGGGGTTDRSSRR